MLFLHGHVLCIGNIQSCSNSIFLIHSCSSGSRKTWKWFFHIHGCSFLISLVSVIPPFLGFRSHISLGVVPILSGFVPSFSWVLFPYSVVVWSLIHLGFVPSSTLGFYSRSLGCCFHVLLGLAPIFPWVLFPCSFSLVCCSHFHMGVVPMVIFAWV